MFGFFVRMSLRFDLCLIVWVGVIQVHATRHSTISRDEIGAPNSQMDEVPNICEADMVQSLAVIDWPTDAKFVSSDNYFWQFRPGQLFVGNYRKMTPDVQRLYAAYLFNSSQICHQGRDNLLFRALVVVAFGNSPIPSAPGHSLPNYHYKEDLSLDGVWRHADKLESFKFLATPQLSAKETLIGLHHFPGTYLMLYIYTGGRYGILDFSLACTQSNGRNLAPFARNGPKDNLYDLLPYEVPKEVDPEAVASVDNRLIWYLFGDKIYEMTVEVGSSYSLVVSYVGQKWIIKDLIDFKNCDSEEIDKVTVTPWESEGAGGGEKKKKGGGPGKLLLFAFIPFMAFLTLLAVAILIFMGTKRKGLPKKEVAKSELGPQSKAVNVEKLSKV